MYVTVYRYLLFLLSSPTGTGREGVAEVTMEEEKAGGAVLRVKFDGGGSSSFELGDSGMFQ